MTRSNNTTRARAHEAKVKQVLQSYHKATGRWPETTKEMADAHDRAYRTTWSAQDTEPEEAIEAYRLLYSNSIKVAVIASAIIFMAFGLGLGYLLFHP